MTQRIGIFLCTCDGKIEENVQIDAFPYVMRANQDVALVQPMSHVCMPDGVRALQDAIRHNHLDRVVVAACPARFQEKCLREACVDVGVNANHFALVDWREGCVDAHRDSKQSITGKAIDLIQMGVARVSKASPVKPAMTEINSKVLVIGGGIAGMTAARTLADRGFKVTLVERQAELGGQLRAMPSSVIASREAAKQSHSCDTEIALLCFVPRNSSQPQSALLAMTSPYSSDAYRATLDAVQTRANIQVLLNSRVVAVDGPVGNYHVRVEIASPTSASLVEFDFGAIVIATGAQELRGEGLFHYDGRRVVTLNEFERELAADWSLITDHSSLVYILCAGSRDERIPYCSNVCCLNALNQAIRVKRASPETRVTILFRDFYLLGDELNEEVVRDARRASIEFARYAASHPPRVSKDAVEVRDELSHTTRRIEYDRLVLATPLIPRPDAGMLARLLKLARDEDGFFPDPHQRVRPEAQLDRGIFVCGSAHRPVDMDTAIMQGMTAAARAARFVQQGEVERAGTSAWVDSQLCTGCAQCVETCTFGAITLTPTLTPPLCSASGALVPRAAGEGTRSVIDPFLCLACGNCVVACPSKAIDLPTESDAQILAQIQAALDARHDGAAPVLVFACQWSGFAAMELAGARRMTYPTNVRVIELPCSARLDPLYVLFAFYSGAEQVMLALCPPNECHFGNGNKYAQARIENLRARLAAHGIDPQRLRIARMMGDDAEAWVRAVAEASGILSRIIPEEISSAWSRYLKFAIYVVGISGGVRVWSFEKYLTPQEPNKEIVQLTLNRWVLEIYETVIGTLGAAVMVLLVFFIFSLIALVIVRAFELKRKD